MKFSKVKIFFDPREVMQYRSKHKKNLMDELTAAIEQKQRFKELVLIKTSFNGLEFIACDENDISEEAFREINESIRNDYSLYSISLSVVPVEPEDILSMQDLSPEFQKFLSDFAEPAKAPNENNMTEAKAPVYSGALEPDSSAPADSAQTDRSGEKEAESGPYNKIYQLIAMDELKAWADEIRQIKEKYSGNPTFAGALLNMSYLISINQGNGCTTAANLMGEVIADAIGKKNVSLKEVYVKVDKSDNSTNVGDIVREFAYPQKESENLYVFLIHIDDLFHNMNVSAWSLLLKKAFENNDKAIYIFAAPYLEDDVLYDIYKRIEDILGVRVLKFAPLSNENYISLFERFFSKYGMTIDLNAHENLLRKISEEKYDGRFYGINTIKKIAFELLYGKIRNYALGKTESENRIEAADVAEMLTDNDSFCADPKISGLEQLDSLVALDNVKELVREIVASIKFERSSDREFRRSMHMMFMGSPGTGKTVVARIIGRIFKDEKLLPIGDFYEVSRRDLVGMYVGHTAPKTAEICKSAYGSVLFIDEAYTLDGGSNNDFGKEAISTLIAEMENNRDHMVVIFSGYEKELEGLFDLNPGLRDRVPHRIRFNNYSREELCRIFFNMLPQELHFNDEFKSAAEEFFEELSDDVMNDKNFSNARFVRNISERVLSKMALRLHMDQSVEDKTLLIRSDFELAVSDVDMDKLSDKKKKRAIGFMSSITA